MARLRSLRKAYLAAFAGTVACTLVVFGFGYLILGILTDPTYYTGPGVRLYVALILLALIGIIAINIWIWRFVFTSVRHDIHSLVRMFKDVRSGTVRPSYPFKLVDFSAAQRYLRRWGMAMLEEKKRLRGMGLIDHLSQLSNRRHLEMRLKELFDNSKAHGISTVLLIDLDKFKQVNDQHGHDAGDAMIVKFAACLRDHVRATDILARLGGDEFCVIYTYLSLKKARELADRLRRSLPREVELKPGIMHQMRWTGGLSSLHSSDTKPDEVLWRADQAMLRAKEAGRNCTIVYDPDTGAPDVRPIINS